MSDNCKNGNILRVAVIGMGKLGLFHSEILSQLPRVDLVAIVDADSRMSSRARSIGILSPSYESFEQLQSNQKVDAVFICTPTFIHLPLVEEVASHGIDVFVEKPFTESYHKSFRLLDIVNSAGIRCAVGYVYSYHPTFRKQIELVKNGAIGRVTEINGTAFHSEVFSPKKGWLFNSSLSGGGAVMNPMSHLLFLAYQAVGLPSTVSARNTTLYSDVEDLSSVRLTYSDDSQGRFVCSWSVPGYPVLQLRLEIRGERGLLIADQFGLKVQLDESFHGLKRGTTHLDISDIETSVKFDPAFENNGMMFVEQDSAFVEGILNNRDLPTEANHAVAMESIIDAIYRSADYSTTVRLSTGGESP